MDTPTTLGRYPILSIDMLHPARHVDDSTERQFARWRWSVDLAVDARFTPSPLSSSTLNVLRETK
jgi:hypothetical protein